MATDRVEVAQFLTQAGDGTGDPEAVGDYSGGAVEYNLKVQQPVGVTANRPEGQVVMVLQSLSIFVGFSATLSAFDHSQYANLPELLNGVKIEIRGAAQATLRNLSAGDAVTTNGGLLSITTRYERMQWLGNGAGANGYNFVYDFDNIFPGGITINETLDEYLSVVVNDDFTGLTNHRFFATGYVGGQVIQ